MFSEHGQRRKVRDVPGFRSGMPVPTRDGSGIRSGDDDDGKPFRPLTFQGRLRAGLSLVLLFKAKATNGLGEDYQVTNEGKAASTMASTLTRWGLACETT